MIFPAVSPRSAAREQDAGYFEPPQEPKVSRIIIARRLCALVGLDQPDRAAYPGAVVGAVAVRDLVQVLLVVVLGEQARALS